MPLTKAEKTIVEGLGTAEQIEKALRQFRRSASLLSSRHAHLIDKYPKQWVAVHRGKVAASALTLTALLQQVDAKSLPREEVIVRFIDRSTRLQIM